MSHEEDPLEGWRQRQDVDEMLVLAGQEQID
jgi:hypothetical protein